MQSFWAKCGIAISVVVCCVVSYGLVDGGIYENCTDNTPGHTRQRRHHVLVTNTKIDVPSDCKDALRYRRPDGKCNNLKHPLWGSVGQLQSRLLWPQYDDGKDSPRTKSYLSGTLPSARQVSVTCHTPSEKKAEVTLMVMQWGQFLGHDISMTGKFTDNRGNSECLCNTTNADCFPIKLDKDKFFVGRDCLPFHRSAHRTDYGRYYNVKARQQINTVTSYIDASNIYGVSDAEVNIMRGEKGLLKSKYNGKYLPEGSPDDCIADKAKQEYCFKAGDTRINEQPGLAILNTVFMRLHNHLVTFWKSKKRSLPDDKLYMEARKVVGALLQKITYSEFLPAVLPLAYIRRYGLSTNNWYYSGENPNIINSFAAAAYRFGHSLIPETIKVTYENDNSHRRRSSRSRRRYQDLDQYISNYYSHRVTRQATTTPSPTDNNGNNNNNGNEGVTLSARYYFMKNLFFKPTAYIEDFDPLAQALVTEKAQAVDTHFSKSVTKHLFSRHKMDGFDLVALNIQRGRDHGLPPYYKYRERSCGGDIMSLRTLFKGNYEAASSVYRHINDVDLFTGGMSEEPLAGGLVGFTFSCILAKQFYRLKHGDRFFYLNKNVHRGGFSWRQIKQINKMSLAKLMCDHTGVEEIQRNVFLPVSQRNPKVKCSQIPGLDLMVWLRQNWNGSQDSS